MAAARLFTAQDSEIGDDTGALRGVFTAHAPFRALHQIKPGLARGPLEHHDRKCRLNQRRIFSMSLYIGL